jgi:hypothetical protein
MTCDLVVSLDESLEVVSGFELLQLFNKVAEHRIVKLRMMCFFIDRIMKQI